MTECFERRMAATRDKVKVPLVVAWGGGVNSTALLIGFHERGIRPDLILFADTGGEKPETYEYLVIFNNHIKDKYDFPEIVVVKNDGKYDSLEENCLATGYLPSKAYGFSSCSDKYKIRPQNKYVDDWGPAETCWAFGMKVRKAIGIDDGERRRAKITSDEKYTYEYPLIDWGWAREECLEAIKRAELPVPIKSACFYCPSSKKKEVFWLQENHPELFERAVAMERNATPNATTTKGLGRDWSWEELVKGGRCALPLFKENTIDTNCMCFDGEE